MKVIARYDFERSPTAATRYILTGHEGKEIPRFLPEYKKSGTAYIEFMRNIQSNKFYEYGFYLGTERGKHRRLTGCNFSPSTPNKTFGDDYCLDRKDTLLFEFTEERNKLVLWFITGIAPRNAFQKWNRNELDLAIKKNNRLEN